jgi:hypothetical protein
MPGARAALIGESVNPAAFHSSKCGSYFLYVYGASRVANLIRFPLILHALDEEYACLHDPVASRSCGQEGLDIHSEPLAALEIDHGRCHR